MIKQILSIASFACVLFISTPGVQLQAQESASISKSASSTKSDASTSAIDSAQNTYNQFLKDNKLKTYASPFITLHQNDKSVYVEMDLSTPQNVLIGATVGRVSNSFIATSGMKIGSPLQYTVSKRDSMVILQLPVTELLVLNSQPKYQQSVEDNFSSITVNKYSIAAYNAKENRVVFDMTSFFVEENPRFELFEQGQVSAMPQSALSNIVEVKSFEKNALVRLNKSYSITLPSNPNMAPYPLSLQLVYTIVKLNDDDKGMIPRASDTRIGVFQSYKTVFDQKTQQMEGVTIVNRWRVEPSDIDAFKRGELVEPIKKITFYIDDAFPQSWRSAIKEGVLRWNSSFEKIGFKNVLQALDYPKDDPTFDPDDIKNSCIRYVAIPEENAMGPSWADPRTGEIINASVFVYGDIAKLIQQWRFAQTAQLDTRTHSKFLHPELLHESLSYIIAHEIGHTLGFMHHMKASSAFTVENLRDVEFTQKYGTTPSIMDYARFNYVAQPEDKGAGLAPPTLGVYDDFLVKWTYSYFPDLDGDFIKEAERLKEMVAEKEHDKRFQYIMQQMGSNRYDPSAIEEDLGDDPQKAADYGLKNVEYILSNLEQWIGDDDDSRVKMRFYEGVAMQALMYTTHVNMNVGGVYLTQASESSGIPRYQSVSKERQRASTLWLLDKAKNIASFGNKELEKTFPSNMDPYFDLIGSIVQQMAVSNIQRVSLSYYLDSTSYTPTEYLHDVYNSVFDKTIRKKQNLTTAEKALQKNFVNLLSRTARTAINTQRIQQQGIANHRDIDELFDLSGMLKQRQRELIDRTHYHCSHHHHVSDVHLGLQQAEFVNPNYGSRYGIPNDIWLQSVDKSLMDMLLYAKKAEKLLEKAVKRTKDPILKAYYKELHVLLVNGIKGA